MNNLRNRVQLIGSLGQEVEFQKLKDGQIKATVPISTKEVYRDQKGQKIVEVHWHYLVGWGETAEHMQVFLKKGTEVAIHGKLTHRTFEDKDGQLRYGAEVVVTEFMLLN